MKKPELNPPVPSVNFCSLCQNSNMTLDTDKQVLLRLLIFYLDWSLLYKVFYINVYAFTEIVMKTKILKRFINFKIVFSKFTNLSIIK